MTELQDLRGCVRGIASELNNLVRPAPDDVARAGWGQFVDAASPVFQIGPYGTAAGVLTSQIASPDAVIDSRIKQQLADFWSERPFGKLFPQTVRLALIVLALAQTKDADLITLRNEITTELLARQRTDGSWSDATPHATAAAGGQPDATAWVILALARINRLDHAAKKGAVYLGNVISGVGSQQILSPIAVAASLYAHADVPAAVELRRRGFALLSESPISKEESISFFDYEMQHGLKTTASRDYLCFPAFYPKCILINALSQGAGVLESVRLTIYRRDAVERLSQFTGGHPYRIPGARFASMVDQAIYALSYEQLAEAESAPNVSASAIVPMYRFVERSAILRLGVPLVLLVCAVATGYKASTVPEALRAFLGPSLTPAVTFADENAAVIQLLSALMLAILPSLPKSSVQFIKTRYFS